MAYKILVADDEPHIRDLLKLLLEDEGYDVVEAEDGEEAYQVAKDEKPDVIILDIMMPKVDGYQAYHSIRSDADLKGIPILILTAKSEPIYNRISKGIGADAHITKPFDADEVLSKLKKFIEVRK
jgi:DNA-binding response OmpR family regulator